MADKSALSWEEWKEELERAWAEIPKPFQSPATVRRTLQCHLFACLRGAGYQVLADYMPPRVADRPVDLLVLDGEGKIAGAVCFDEVVTLYAVKSLTSFDSPRKVIFTVGRLKKKVEESRFFLKEGVEHVHLEAQGLQGP
ncbi:hypothetical protein SAMN02745206_02571 [Desulfacinum infernum DSM 9756]|uniref:Uncharacterized protein n=1 Tax=Desulfacinum infernum DSM 9756 TaxID=1121391 RepID=A0A1M5E5V8_9BACT|nr:hypothetical protein [Desulfacinum infernum]SHF74451.1 hypothetical protein SAMN02745206_02571 [Desulfacinum infernum DSM 9756]